LATRRPGRLEGKDDAKAGSVAGYGQALKLSSEFIAGVVVGAGIGWIIDRLAGTSPWGLIVFLLLGFGAGVLNVMRSAGVVAEFGQGDKSRRGQDDKK
ncbi:ATP F0F1 synthase subunit I, partial [Mesorhizobium sp. M7A.F.Ca.MR.228.00.0.0]